VLDSGDGMYIIDFNGSKMLICKSYKICEKAKVALKSSGK